MSMLMTQALFPSLLTYLKRRAQKSTRFLFLSRIPEFIYECIQNTKRENKVEGEGRGGKDSTRRAAKVYGWYEELFRMTVWNLHRHEETLAPQETNRNPLFLEHGYNKSKTVKWRNKPGKLLCWLRPRRPSAKQPCWACGSVAHGGAKHFCSERKMEVYQCQTKQGKAGQAISCTERTAPPLSNFSFKNTWLRVRASQVFLLLNLTSAFFLKHKIPDACTALLFAFCCSDLAADANWLLFSN